jgi:hypothetical protein
LSSTVIIAGQAPRAVPGTRATIAYSVAFAWLLLPYLLRDHVGDRSRFIFSTIVLTVYLAGEIAVEIWRDRRRWLLHPAVLGSIGTFILSFSLTNYALLDVNGSGYMRLTTGLEGDDGFYWLARAMDLVLPAAPAMWLAYRSGIGRGLAAATRSSLERFGFLRATEEPRQFAIVALVVTATLARITQLRLGILGYGSEVEALYTYASYSMLLSMASDLARLALLIVALRFFMPGGRSQLPMLVTLLVMESLFGFVLGFKGRVVAPIVSVAVCAYAIRGRVQLRYVWIGVIALGAAYVIIEPFRLLRYADPEFNGRSFRYLVTTLSRARGLVDEQASRQFLSSEATDITAMRTNSTLDLAVTKRYVDANGVPPGAPDFLKNIVTSPIQAVVPRIVWKSKPLQNIGVWYAQTVWKQENDINSLGMSPFGYLYFAGGAWMIVAGFVLLGVFQRYLHDTFRDAGLAGLLVYLAVIPSVAIADSAFYTIFGGTLQIAIAMLVVLRLTMAPATRRQSVS